MSDLLFSERCHSCARLLIFLDTFAVHIPHPVSIRSSVFAGYVIHVPCCYFLLIHSSFMGRILCPTYTLFMYHIRSSLTCYTHSSLYASHSSVINVSDSVSIHVSVIRLLDLSSHLSRSFVGLISVNVSDIELGASLISFSPDMNQVPGLLARVLRDDLDKWASRCTYSSMPVHTVTL